MAYPISGTEEVVRRLILEAVSRYTLCEFQTLPREQRSMSFWLSDPGFWNKVMALKPSLGPAPALAVNHQDLRLFPFTAFASSGNLATFKQTFDSAMRRQMESYRCTVDGVSIFGMNVGSGRAFLFPGDLLRGLHFVPPRASHLVEAAFQTSTPDALTGTLAFQTDARLEWNEGVIFELTKELPPLPTGKALPTKWETAFSWLAAQLQGVTKRQRGLRGSDRF